MTRKAFSLILIGGFAVLLLAGSGFAGAGCVSRADTRKGCDGEVVKQPAPETCKGCESAPCTCPKTCEICKCDPCACK